MTMDVHAVVSDKLARHVSLASPQALQLTQRLEELELDSLALLEAVYQLEEHFDITLDTERLLAAETVRDLVMAVQACLDCDADSP